MKKYCFRCAAYITNECDGILLQEDFYHGKYICFEPLDYGLIDSVPLTYVGGIWLDDEDLRELI